MGIRGIKEEGDVYKMIHMDYYGRCNEKQILCQMCKRIEDSMFDSCKSKTEFERDLFLKISGIKLNCKYRGTAYDEYTLFDTCNKKGNCVGRNADDCIPTLECEKYCNQKEDLV